MPEEKQYKGKERFKGYNSGDKAVREGVDTTYDGLDDNLKSFVDKLSEKFGEGEVVFTSGYRGEDDRSTHFHGNAVDMRPNPKVWNYLVNEEEGINLMVEHGLNMLDESDPKKLKGNAPHFHVSTGKYSNAVHSADRYEKIGTDEFEVVRPFVEVYAEHTGTVYDYSQPVAYDPEKMEYVSENVYKDNYSPTSTGNISMTHYEGDGHDHGQEGAADNINETNERLLKELEILRKERESSEAEAELEAEEQEYLKAQQAELDRRNQMVQREQQMISERQQTRPVGQLAPQPQQGQPHPTQAFSGQISPPDFIYSLGNNLPPLPEFSAGGEKEYDGVHPTDLNRRRVMEVGEYLSKLNGKTYDKTSSGVMQEIEADLRDFYDASGVKYKLDSSGRMTNDELYSSFNKYTGRVRNIQETLEDHGLYSGGSTGVLNDSTVRAYNEYLKKNKYALQGSGSFEDVYVNPYKELISGNADNRTYEFNGVKMVPSPDVDGGNYTSYGGARFYIQ